MRDELPQRPGTKLLLILSLAGSLTGFLATHLTLQNSWRNAVSRIDRQLRQRNGSPYLPELPADPVVGLFAVTGPQPHQVPARKGGVAFRFVMAHDVLVQRFPQHSTAYYQARNELSRKAIAGLPEGSPETWPHLDDLCVGLEKIGQTDQAIPLMRDKLARQQLAGITGRQLYTSLANLGTFLIHASFAPARSGDQAALTLFREGIELIRQSVQVNPNAHFGREEWQLVIAQFLLLSFENPALLTSFDCLGNDLQASYEELIYNADLIYSYGLGRPSAAFVGSPYGGINAFRDFYPPRNAPNDPAVWEDYKAVRLAITRIGPTEYNVRLRQSQLTWWPNSPPLPQRNSPPGFPFDQPMLGIVGMWREGGGANPHFALAIGETMLRVGQRYLAWTAYQRAIELADRYSPDPAIQSFLKAHCKRRQQELLDSYPPDQRPDAEVLMMQFAQELAFGREFQQACEASEEQQLAQGVSVDDPDFNRDFIRAHPEIATTPGDEELARYLPNGSDREFRQYVRQESLNYALFGAGLGAFVGGVIRRFRLARWRLTRMQPVDTAAT